MSEGIPYADLLILALVAGFILLRLRSVLGRQSGDDGPYIPPQTQNRKPEPMVIPLPDKAAKMKPKDEPDSYLESIKDKESDVAAGIRAIKERDPQFVATEFMEGARRAFEMLFDAFVKGEKNTLRMLLSDTLYKEFEQAAEARATSDRKEETTLVSILNAEMTQARLMGNMAQISVRFTSEQVTVVRGTSGEIIEGDPSQLQHVEDEWLFERDTQSKSPNWKIIET